MLHRLTDTASAYSSTLFPAVGNRVDKLIIKGYKEILNSQRKLNSLFLPTGTFVVNVGDPLEAWTRGLYRASIHRVRSSPNKHRYSAPFFYGPNPKCVIEPLDSDLTRHLTYNPEFLLKMPFRFGDYYHAKFQQSFDWFSK